MEILRVETATYRYVGAGRPALVDIDLSVEAGQVVGVVGPNEAGKSTLCLVASGLAPATIGGSLKGRVLVAGAETASQRPHELAQRCGILFENATTQLSGTTSTVFEEIAFGPRNLALPLGEVVERVESAMDTLGIADLAARHPGRLSGGQAQLVALASVLALRPSLLVLDEPTSQLDPQGTRLVGDTLAHLASETGVGLLIVEHKTDLLDRLADRVVVLAEGRLVREGVARDVLSDPALPDLGVEAPSQVRLTRALSEAGLAVDPAAWLEAAR